MKKLFLVALALITLQSFAQEPPQQMERAPKKERKQKMKDLSAEEQATLSTKKMTLALDLNEKQQAQVKEVLLAQFEKRPTKPGKKEELTKEDRVKMMNERLDAQIAVKKQMKSILTEEQYEKFDKMQARRLHDDKRKQKMKKKQ